MLAFQSGYARVLIGWLTALKLKRAPAALALEPVGNRNQTS